MKYCMYCDVCGHKIKVFEDNTSNDEIIIESRENFRNYAKKHMYEMISCDVCGSAVTLIPELADRFTYVDIAPENTVPIDKSDGLNDEFNPFSNEPKFADLDTKEKQNG